MDIKNLSQPSKGKFYIIISFVFWIITEFITVWHSQDQFNKWEREKSFYRDANSDICFWTFIMAKLFGSKYSYLLAFNQHLGIFNFYPVLDCEQIYPWA